MRNCVRAIINGARSCGLPRFCSSGCVRAKLRPVPMLGLKKLNALFEDCRTAVNPADTVGPSPSTWLKDSDEFCESELRVAAPLVWLCCDCVLRSVLKLAINCVSNGAFDPVIAAADV